MKRIAYASAEDLFSRTQHWVRIDELRTRIDNIWSRAIFNAESIPSLHTKFAHEANDEGPRSHLNRFSQDNSVVIAMMATAFKSNMAIQLSPRLLRTQYAQVVFAIQEILHLR